MLDFATSIVAEGIAEGQHALDMTSLRTLIEHIESLGEEV